MTIAALVEIDEVAEDPSSPLEMPWPRPVLRVVPTGGDAERGDGAGDEAADDDVPPAAVATQVRRGLDVAVRRAVRDRILQRRRRVVLGLAVAGLCVGLGLPLSALGGAAPQPLRVPGTALTGSTVYVVQPGDTLWSIAARFDRGGDPRPLAEAIARETGSGTVVPGEHIAIP